jgi:hypothetical protein
MRFILSFGKEKSMASENSNSQSRKQDLEGLIDSLQLSDLQKHLLRSRWLDQVLWMGEKAGSAQKRYYALRLIAIVGGVIVPALVGLKIGEQGISPCIQWTTFFLSLIVAISVAVEEFFHYGERWRHYRRTVECLKTEGWQFFQLAGPYQQPQTHSQAFPDFAAQIEKICRQEVDVFIAEVAKEKKEKPAVEKN